MPKMELIKMSNYYYFCIQFWSNWCIFWDFCLNSSSGPGLRSTWTVTDVSHHSAGWMETWCGLWKRCALSVNTMWDCRYYQHNFNTVTHEGRLSCLVLMFPWTCMDLVHSTEGYILEEDRFQMIQKCFF